MYKTPSQQKVLMMCSLYALWRHINFSQNLTEIPYVSQKDGEMPHTETGAILKWECQLKVVFPA